MFFAGRLSSRSALREARSATSPALSRRHHPGVEEDEEEAEPIVAVSPPPPLAALYA